MKRSFALLLSSLLGACATPQKPVDLRSEFVGAYRAEHAIDTVENLALQADGMFVYDYIAIFGESARYEGRWEVRDAVVVLVAVDTNGKEVEFPLQIFRRTPDLTLVYSHESYATRAKMLLPDTYRRTSKTPNQPVQHNAGSRPPSRDSLVPETPSSLGPRG